MRRGWRMLWVVIATAIACEETGPPAPPALAPSTQPLPCTAGEALCLAANVDRFDVDGLRVLLKRIPGDATVSMQVFYDEIAERADPTRVHAEKIGLWIAAVAGSWNDTGGSWDRRLAELGATVSAEVELDFASLVADAPRPYWRDVWRLVTEAILDPRIGSSNVEHYRLALQSRFATELDESRTAAHVTAWSRLYQGHPYNLDRESIAELDEIDDTSVVRAWDALQTRDRMLVAVVGDVDPNELREEVEQAFRWVSERGDDPAPEPSSPGPSQSTATILEYPGEPTWHVRGYFAAPSPVAHDYPAWRMALAILDRRLFERVREEAGLAYTVGASQGFLRDNCGYLGLSTSEPGKALETIRAVLDEMLAAPPAPAELDAERRIVETGLLVHNQTNEELCWTLGRWELLTGHHADVDAYVDRLAAVVPEDIPEVLRAYLSNVQFAAAGDGAEIDEAMLLDLVPDGAPPEE